MKLRNRDPSGHHVVVRRSATLYYRGVAAGWQRRCRCRAASKIDLTPFSAPLHNSLPLSCGIDVRRPLAGEFAPRGDLGLRVRRVAGRRLAALERDVQEVDYFLGHAAAIPRGRRTQRGSSSSGRFFNVSEGIASPGNRIATDMVPPRRFVDPDDRLDHGSALRLTAKMG